MKKMILVAGVLLLLNAQAYAPAGESAADKLVAFSELEKKHKSDWFSFMKKAHDAKFDLLQKAHADWAANHVKSIQNLQHLANCTPEEKNKFFTQELDQAVALHEKQVEKFKKLCQDHQKEALAIQERHQKELDKFLGRPEKMEQKEQVTNKMEAITKKAKAA